MKPALVILAAGRSARLGECKATVTIGERTALGHLLEEARGLFDEAPIVVTGADDDRIVRVLPPEVERVFNPGWELGRTAGLALARARRPGRDLCVAPVDCPLVPRAVFAALLEHWREQGSPEDGWLAPCSAPPGEAERDGHPIVLGRGLAARLDSLGADEPLRRLRERASPRLSLPVLAPEIHDDLDTPADLARLRERAARLSIPTIEKLEAPGARGSDERSG